MFLMNASPLVALQPNWELFSHSRSFRYPICFSESEDDIARTSVSTKVQVIINNLQSEEASVSSNNHEYRCLMQTEQKGGNGRDPKPRSNVQTLQECLQYPAADSDGMEVEESSKFGPLSLNSDSDASVDRDIEEAIQEYLRNKVAQGGQLLASKTKSSTTRDRENSAQQEHPFGHQVGNMLHVNVKTEMIQRPLSGPEVLENNEALSPCSMSSDDSFEESIKAEIEQFLNEKKQQAKRRRDKSGQNKPFEPKGTKEKPAIQSQKEAGSRVSQSSPGRGSRSLCFRPDVKLQGTQVSQCLKSKPSDQFADVQFRTPATGHFFILEGRKGQKPGKDRGEVKLENRNGSDSSSDDGIEEAIQLYQREKIRRAADARRECVSFPNKALQANEVEDTAAVLRVHSVKSALSETPRKTLSQKRKQVLSKIVHLDRSSPVCQEDKCWAPTGRDISTCATMLQTCRQTGTAAELMCAEAILDISNTILPLPGERGDHRSFTTDPIFSPPNVQMFPQENNNAVDSDDSIEQEIRAFLAVKAQTGHLVTKSKETSSSHHLPSLGQSDEKARSPKVTLPKALRMSRQRRFMGESKISTLSPDKVDLYKPDKAYPRPLMKSEMDSSCTDDHNSKLSAAQQEHGVSLLQNVKFEGDALAAVHSVAMGNSFSRGRLRSRNHMKNAMHNQPIYRAGDKSSSLDSDEDLDTAIKDLLRSKRKRKRKGKDQRIQCKNKVGFGVAEMHLFEGEGQGQTPALLRICLVDDKRETHEENTKILVKGKREDANNTREDCQVKQFSEPEIQATSKHHESPETGRSLTEDSSAVDSDDSIEQEIQKFLAEKAKDATCAVNTPRSSAVAETQEVNKPHNSLPKARCQSAKHQGSAQSKQRRKGEMMEQFIVELTGFPRSGKETVGNASSDGKPVVSHTERMCSPVTAVLHAHRGPVHVPNGPGLPAKRAAIETKVVCKSRCGSRDLQPQRKLDIEDHRLKSYFKPLKRKNVCEFKISSKFIAGLKSAQTKKKSVLWGKCQSKEFVLPKRLGKSTASDVWSGRCEMNPQQGTLGSRNKAVVGNGELSIAKGWRACTSEMILNTQDGPSPKEMGNPAKVRPLGVERPGYGANFGQGFCLEDAGLDGVGRVGLSTQLSHVVIHSREGKSPGELPLREKSDPGPERAAEDQTPKASDGNSAELATGLW